MTRQTHKFTEDELYRELVKAWNVLHAVKVRFVRATCQEEHEHYLQAIDEAEAEHKRLYAMFTNREYRSEETS